MISSVSTHPSGADTQRDITSTSDGTAGHQDVLDSNGGSWLSTTSSVKSNQTSLFPNMNSGYTSQFALWSGRTKPRP